MSALATEHDAVNLGQGFPDYPIDPALIELVAAAMRAGHNQYPLSAGLMALREAIAAKVLRLYGRAYDPEREVTVTTGATQAIYTSIQALAHPGDEAILFEPAYDSYIPSIRMAHSAEMRASVIAYLMNSSRRSARSRSMRSFE